MTTIFISILSILIWVFGFNDETLEENRQLRQEIAQLNTIIGPPPKSLDNLYPPKSDGPLYLFMMFEMARPFTAMNINLFEKNLEGAKTNYEMFKNKYTEIAGKVPEWEEAYPFKPVEDLGTALSSGEQEKILMTIKNVAKICNDCHTVNMPKIQQKYHWQDFSEIVVTDPISGEDMNYKQHMMSLETSFQGIGLSLEQGQVEKSLQYFNSFNKRFESMEETCAACHENGRKYYVDSTVKEMLDTLGVTLRSKKPDMNLVGDLSRRIGNESCFKCHLVHIPAAYTKSMWKESHQPE